VVALTDEERQKLFVFLKKSKGAARKPCRSLYMCVGDQPHTKWVNLYNRKEKRSCIKLPFAAAQPYILMAELAAGIVRGILWPRICTPSFTIYQSPLEPEEKNGKKILY
jgi:hypothetical protein